MKTVIYQAHALTVADRPPSDLNMPVVVQQEDLKSYLGSGWVVTGKATITVEYLDQEEIQAQQLCALKDQLQIVRAENQQRENAILDQISKLSSLTYEAA